MPTKAKKAIAKSKTSSKAKSNGHRLDISFSGRGTQAYAYVVKNQFISDRKLAIENEDEFEISDVVDDYAIASYLVCKGISEDAEIKIEFDGEEIVCNGIIDEENEDEYELDELENFMKFKPIESMGEGIKIPENCHLVIEVLHYQYGILRTSFNIPESHITPSQLFVLTRDVDTETELSLATYENGLLNEVEHDWVQIQYKDEIFDMDLDFSGICSGGYYLVSKSASGSFRGYEEL
jgi:hypothetical protein